MASLSLPAYQMAVQVNTRQPTANSAHTWVGVRVRVRAKVRVRVRVRDRDRVRVRVRDRDRVRVRVRVRARFPCTHQVRALREVEPGALAAVVAHEEVERQHHHDRAHRLRHAMIGRVCVRASVQRRRKESGD